MAEISLWNKIAKEERKHLQVYHAVASTQTAVTECFGRLAAMENVSLSSELCLEAPETTFAKNTHFTRDGCRETPEFWWRQKAVDEIH